MSAMALAARFSPGRLGAVLAKEFVQMRRDRITFGMMLGVPLIQLVLFGFAINSDPKALPAALVVLSQDQYSRAMVSALETTGYYRFDHIVHSEQEGEFLISRGDVVVVSTVTCTQSITQQTLPCPSLISWRVVNDVLPTWATCVSTVTSVVLGRIGRT